MAFKDLSSSMQSKVKAVEACYEEEGRQRAKETQAYKTLSRSEELCGALQGDGSVCCYVVHYKEDGTTNKRCFRHGGKSTGATTAEGKAKAISKLRGRSPVHGLYSKDFLEGLTDEELQFMEWAEKGVRESYHVDTVIEEISLNMLIMEAVRHFRIVNSKFASENKNASEFLTKFLRLVESQGWRKKDEIDNKRSGGLSAKQLVDLLSSLEGDEEEQLLN